MHLRCIAQYNIIHHTLLISICVCRYAAYETHSNTDTGYLRMQLHMYCIGKKVADNVLEEIYWFNAGSTKTCEPLTCGTCWSSRHDSNQMFLSRFFLKTVSGQRYFWTLLYQLLTSVHGTQFQMCLGLDYAFPKCENPSASSAATCLFRVIAKLWPKFWL